MSERRTPPSKPPSRTSARVRPRREELDERRLAARAGSEDATDATDEEFEAPPIPGKAHPTPALSDAVPTLDDDVRNYHHHPNESGVIDFDVDPYAGDAAADLAGDLGSEFLEGATRGQDMSDVMMTRDDQEGEAGFLYEEEMMGSPDEEEEEEEEAPAERPPEGARPAVRAGVGEAAPPSSERRVKATPPIRRAAGRRR